MPRRRYLPRTGRSQHAVSGLQRGVEQVPGGVRPHGTDVRAADDGKTCCRPHGTPEEAAAGAPG